MIKLLDRLGITDDGYVDLPNLLTYVVLVKLALAAQVGVGEISALLGVLVSHLGHHAIDSKAPQIDSQVAASVAELQTKVTALQLSGQAPRRQ